MFLRGLQLDELVGPRIVLVILEQEVHELLLGQLLRLICSIGGAIRSPSEGISEPLLSSDGASRGVTKLSLVLLGTGLLSIALALLGV